MISNGGNFMVAARLAYITGNSSYADWADMVWDWMADSQMFERDGQGLLYIWDNVNADKDCGDPVNFIWSYNYGVLLGGAAYMYNFTDGAQEWKDRVDELLSSALQLYFPQENGGGNVMVEYLCEDSGLCNQDQKSFKAYLTRWLVATALLVPDTWDIIYPKLMSSAAGAATQCTGGASGSMCSSKWYENTPDGQTGVGEQVSSTYILDESIVNSPQMSALAAVGATLMQQSMAPLSLDTGAVSESRPNPVSSEANDDFPPVTTADKAGAAILTILTVVAFVGAMVWIILD